ncbi:MAG: IS66 family transposase, partial [Clostridiales bacterium]|nr:IS66 family transposase [Clostridiales bacterium]
AITYSLNQREYLCAFLDHGEIEISNNQVENAIRPIVVGRKNWLFCDTQAGAEASVMIFTMLKTAKANGLNPETYLNHILTVLPDRFVQDPKAPIDDLLPWAADIHRQFAL